MNEDTRSDYDFAQRVTRRREARKLLKKLLAEGYRFELRVRETGESHDVTDPIATSVARRERQKED